jgi:Amt family ammonium transporter
VVTWVAIEWLHRKKPTVLGAASAAVAGLVAITPACGFVSPLSSIAIGAGASVFCYIAITVIKPAWGYDDSLDVFGVHGIGGMWGALATGLFIMPSMLPEGVTWGGQVIAQLSSIGITAVYAMSITFAILLVLRTVMGSLRVSEDSEFEGLDLSLHSESAYSDLSAGTLIGSAAGERLREESRVPAGKPAPAPAR